MVSVRWVKRSLEEKRSRNREMRLLKRSHIYGSPEELEQWAVKKSYNLQGVGRSNLEVVGDYDMERK